MGHRRLPGLGGRRHRRAGRGRRDAVRPSPPRHGRRRRRGCLRRRVGRGRPRAGPAADRRGAGHGHREQRLPRLAPRRAAHLRRHGGPGERGRGPRGRPPRDRAAHHVRLARDLHPGPRRQRGRRDQRAAPGLRPGRRPDRHHQHQGVHRPRHGRRHRGRRGRSRRSRPASCRRCPTTASPTPTSARSTCPAAGPTRWSTRCAWPRASARRSPCRCCAGHPVPDGRRRAPDELGYAYRVVDRAAWQRWLDRLAGHTDSRLEVDHRRLRVVDAGPATIPVERSGHVPVPYAGRLAPTNGFRSAATTPAPAPAPAPAAAPAAAPTAPAAAPAPAGPGRGPARSRRPGPPGPATTCWRWSPTSWPR